jgi:hypothetical protein
MDLKLTDHAVSLLPLQTGRAELLEEIMSTAVSDRQTAEPTDPPTRRRGWLVPAAAAAVVAGIAVSSLWWQHLGGDGDGKNGDPTVASSLDLPQGQGIVLDAPGWKVDALGSDGLRFRKGDADLEVTSYPADSYDSYVLDREHIVEPPTPGEPIEVLGRAAQMWAYSADDHTAIREVEDGHWMEFRAQGLDEKAYLALLGRLRLATETEFDASLPKDFVAKDERLPEALKIVGAITGVSGAGFPDGASNTFGSGEAQDRYQFGVEVAGAYACAWLEEFENAQAHAQTDRAAEAARVLGTSRQWPILKEMDADGGYSEVVWDYADEVAAGQVPEGYREGLGCP